MPALLVVALAAGCGDDSADPPGVRSQTPDPIDSGDGGQAVRLPPSARPADGPTLPPADAVLEVVLGGDSATYRIEVDADLGALDLHFSIDTSASIGAEIDQLQADLESQVITKLRERVADVSFGVSRFEDFPAPPFGADGRGGAAPDTPFELLTPITSDLEQLRAAFAILDRPLGFGGDNREAGAEALYQIATGEGYRHNRQQLIAAFMPPRVPPPGSGDLGGVGFRARTMHVVMHVTDAPSHAPEDYGSTFPGTRSLEQAAQALRAIDARVIGIISGLCPELEPDAADGDDEADADPNDPRPAAGCRGVAADDPVYERAREQLEDMALATGASQPAQGSSCPFGLDASEVDAREDNCPYVFDVAANGSGLPETVVESVVTLVDGVRFAVISAGALEDPLGFIEHIDPIAIAQPEGVAAPEIADLLPVETPDGVLDSFVDVRSRTRLAFDVTLRNTRIAATDADQSFRVIVQVLGDGLLIAEPVLRVVIPAGPPRPPGGGDGGVAADDDGGTP